MSKVLVVGYGASSGNLARLYSGGRFPILLIDKKSFGCPESPCESHLILDDDLESNTENLCRVMSEYSYVVLVASLASTSFPAIYDEMLKCASNSKTILVLFCTLPFVFESERRERAIGVCDSFSSDFGNVFIFDYQKTLNGDFLPESYSLFLESTNGCVAKILGVIVRLLETSPFFSYCSDPVYTMAVGAGKQFTEAVTDALGHPFYGTVAGCGKILVFTDKHLGEHEREQATRLLSVRGNAMPEFVGGSGLGEDKALLFIPTSFRLHG